MRAVELTGNKFIMIIDEWDAPIREEPKIQKKKQWYDGYTFSGIGAVYNPGSVMEAIRNDDFDSYWPQTSAAESLMGYISLDVDGLSKTIAELIGGDILLVGINYDKDAPAGKRKHSCVIEKYRI